jgi:ribosomal protein L11 methylase PrmA
MGTLVMSGILIEQAMPLMDHYRNLGMDFVCNNSQEDWALVAANQKPRGV